MEYSQTFSSIIGSKVKMIVYIVFAVVVRVVPCSWRMRTDFRSNSRSFRACRLSFVSMKLQDQDWSFRKIHTIHFLWRHESFKKWKPMNFLERWYFDMYSNLNFSVPSFHTFSVGFTIKTWALYGKYLKPLLLGVGKKIFLESYSDFFRNHVPYSL